MISRRAYYPGMAAIVRIHDGGPHTVQLSVWLKEWRQVMVTVQTKPGEGLRMEIWARHREEKHFHAWPGPHTEELLTPFEDAVIRFGVEEAAICASRQRLDQEFVKSIVGALTIVLDAAANGIPEESEAAA